MDNIENSFDEFGKWFTPFIKRNGGFKPNHLAFWYKKVEKSHNNIRKFLGCTKVQRFFKIDSAQEQASEELAKPIIDRIIQILPDYLLNYNFTRDVFLNPVIPDGDHKVIRVGKHVRHYASQALRSGDGTKFKELDDLLSKLGNLWNKTKTNDVELEITLSTTPKGFALLGHYGPDESSCFKQGGGSQINKYSLAQTENTFVISIGKFFPQKNKFKNVARCFGFVDNNFTTFNICNYYFTKHICEGDSLFAIKKLLEELAKCKLTMLEGIIGVGHGVVQNNYGNWSFIKDGVAAITQRLMPNISNIETFYCSHCDVNKEHDIDWLEVDGNLICKKCADSANICDFSLERTFSQLTPVILKSGVDGMVHPKYLVNFTKCKDCEVLFHKNAKDTIDICPSCVEIHYETCDQCSKVMEMGMQVEVQDLVLCQECSKELYHPEELEYFIKLSQI